MIVINQIKLDISHTEEQLRNKVCKALQLNKDASFEYGILKRSLDARKKPALFFVYSIYVKCEKEERILKRNKGKNIARLRDFSYKRPVCGDTVLPHRPVVIGAGPAGLFAAYLLTELGYKPIVIERGKDVDNRKKDVQTFWETGALDTESNVQFGEGGAGTFSDGKLNTAVKDSNNRQRFVLETFIKYGANPNILYDNKPHIGTDVLCTVIKNMREDLIKRGCEFCFETKVTDFVIENQTLTKVICEEKEIPCEVCVLAIGHSARDTFRRIHELQIPMECKNFAVGFRVEHPQDMINESQYGSRGVEGLMASPYKVTSNFPNGRGVYSFCMCPGGYVVNSSSMEGYTVVNGMSYSKRDSTNANSAIIVSVGPKDYKADDPLAGMRYQMELEKKVYELGKGMVPQQLFGDYCKNQTSLGYGEFETCLKGTACFSNLRGIFNEEIEESFIEAMHHFNKIIDGFDREDAILSGVEARTSSPVRIQRNENFESAVKGLYPCGEGAGYAGGIMSAAMDGLKVAEAIIQKYERDSN